MESELVIWVNREAWRKLMPLLSPVVLSIEVEACDEVAVGILRIFITIAETDESEFEDIITEFNDRWQDGE